jgi:serine/threonine protein kinase
MTLAHIAVKKAGLEHAVPCVYEIFCHTKPHPQDISDLSSICISMEYIHGNTLLKYMRTHFKKENPAENDILFLNFLSQIAAILAVLQTTLRMNHRDIKINNILLREHSTNNPVIVLIDYGFACIANGIQEPHEEMPKIEAGAFFGSRYACFKHGRDICQFIYSLHCHFPFEKYLSPSLLELIKPWMMVHYKYGVANLLNGVTSSGRAVEEKVEAPIFDEGIYYFLRRPEVDPLQCSPQRIMDDIAKYRQTLQVEASKIEATAGDQTSS